MMYVRVVGSYVAAGVLYCLAFAFTTSARALAGVVDSIFCLCSPVSNPVLILGRFLSLTSSPYPPPRPSRKNNSNQETVNNEETVTNCRMLTPSQKQQQPRNPHAQGHAHTHTHIHTHTRALSSELLKNYHTYHTLALI